jgi:2-polyprenyl-3-methyl-5-hydroxy-6-metoxy-1,4-benzoquinol methylase/peptidoglycan/xylan/chitin deacetylase (PgdA/CDA1 family)
VKRFPFFPSQKCCKLCGGNARHLYTTPNRWAGVPDLQHYCCGRCGLVFVGDRLDLRQLQSAYKELDGESHQHQDCEDSEAKFAATVKSIAENFPAGCAILDIGTGSGEFARLLRHDGHNDVSVHEIPGTNLEHLKEHGIRVYQDFDYRSIPDNSFDVVALFDVAEHALDPLALFRACHRVLRRGGILYAYFPTITRVDRMMHCLRHVPILSRVGRRWQEGRTSIFHLQIFTPAAIEIALRKAGFLEFETSQRNLLIYSAEHYVRLHLCEKQGLPASLTPLITPLVCPLLATDYFNANRGFAWARKSKTIQTQSQNSNDAFSFWKLPEQWREALAPTIDTSEAVASRYLFEEYLAPRTRREMFLMNTYYRVRSLIPPAMRHRLNRSVVLARNRRKFPQWPCETSLIDVRRDWLRASLEKVNTCDGWHIGFWPHGQKTCVVLTHDVESPIGMSRMERMADLEERYGFLSAWNLPLVEYQIDWNLVERLRVRGFEFGAHGLAHDGNLFRSRKDFDRFSAELQHLAGEHGMLGFRSPSTLRNAEWIASMSFDYDSSFSDTDPYEPQPGGSCNLFPFHLYGILELPYTLPQDHTLIHLLRRDPLPVWITKADWINSLGGMILTITHPDYIGTGLLLNKYEDLLKRLNDFRSVWRALPYQVANWWRERSAMTLRVDDDVPHISGKGFERAVPRRLSSEPLAGLDPHRR